MTTMDGLEGVVVAETRLSRRRRRARAAGDSRARRRGAGACAHDFEAACALLWTGELPAPAAHAELRGAARPRARARLRAPAARSATRSTASDGMEALRGALAHLRASEIPERELRVELTAAVAVFAAAWARARGAARRRSRPIPTLGHAADYLRMASAHGSDPARSRALDAYLVTVADHGMNASTFTARVVASTESDTVSAVVAALGALKGPRHGGAPGPVLDMLDAIGAPERAAAGSPPSSPRAGASWAWATACTACAIRARRCSSAPSSGCARPGLRSDRLDLARAVERVAVASLGERRPERRLAANVEFYTAVLLDAIGLPQELFSPTFAVARVAGWLAHVDEQRAAAG